MKFKMAAHAKMNDPMLSLLFLFSSLTQKTYGYVLCRHQNQNQKRDMEKKQFRSECRGGHFKIQDGYIH